MVTDNGELVPQKIRLAAESLTVTKRTVETGRVVLRKTVETVDHPLEHTLAVQALTVEHVPIGRVVAAIPDIREEDGVTIVPIVEERIVVTTELFLREEVHIRRTDSQQTMRQTVPLRREVVHVEQTSSDQQTSVNAQQALATPKSL